MEKRNVSKGRPGNARDCEEGKIETEGGNSFPPRKKKVVGERKKQAHYLILTENLGDQEVQLTFWEAGKGHLCTYSKGKDE